MRVLSVIVSALLVATAASAADKPEAAKKSQFKPPAGYKVKIKEWDIVYCRKEAVLGSRFPKEICMTEAELKAYLAANEEMRRNKDQSSRICGGTGCD